jgi:cyanophycin synthetase
MQPQQSDSLPPLEPGRPPLQFRRQLFLRGPNIWSRHPILEVWVDLGNLKEWSSELIPGFNERYKAWLPSVIEHRCSEGVRGGFFIRLDRGTYLAHILEHTTLELQSLAGCSLGYGRAREMSEEGVYKVAVRYEDETVVEECLKAARALLIACVYDLPFDVKAEIERLHDLAERKCLGPSSKAILAAAQARNIPFRRLNTGSLVQLGQGAKQHRIWTAETDQTSAIAETIASDKQLTKQLLAASNIPVPRGRLVIDEVDAWKAAREIRGSAVVKPRDGNHGRGVFPNLTQEHEVIRAFQQAANEGSGVIVEQFIPGVEHRVLVVGNRVSAASRGDPVFVEGDGRRTVAQLVEEDVNSDPRRGSDESHPLCFVRFNEVVRVNLAKQGFTEESIPNVGQKVIVKQYDNLSVDVTDFVHPLIAHHCVLAAQVVGLDIAGIDMVLTDIARPMEEQGGAIVEVNAGPGLLMHLKPSEGKPRPVGEDILNLLYSPSDDGRIPIVSVTGTAGKTTVTRLVRGVLAESGFVVGLADSDGKSVGNWDAVTGNSDHASAARDVLLNPNVTAAVFEAGLEGILREGLGYDKCTVAIVTNFEKPDHLAGEFDLYDEEKIFSVKRTPVDVVMESGTAVLNASESVALRLKPLSKGPVILFAREASCNAVVDHLAESGRAVVVDGSHIWLRKAQDREIFAPMADLLPGALGQCSFLIDNLLAAIAACWHMEIPKSTIIAGLKKALTSPSVYRRLHIETIDGQTHIYCEAVNLAGLHTLVDWINSAFPVPVESRSIAFQLPHDRRSEDYAALGDFLADHFSSVHLVKPKKPSKKIEPIEIMKTRLQGKSKQCEVSIKFSSAAKAAKATSAQIVVMARHDHHD